MRFEILGDISNVETIAAGSGKGRWRKRKGNADVTLGGGEIVCAEVHWYEATGIGKREFKIKRLL
jgi:hypothetical protein